MSFSFFGKKEQAVKVTDKVWGTSEAKWKACCKLAAEQPATLFVAWFDDTSTQLKTYAANQSTILQVISAREVSAHILQNATLVFIEHYPLKNKEQALFEKLGLKQVTIYSALDEAFFQFFGAGKIQQVFKSLGVADDECIEHTMITTAIQNAQETIEKKILIDQSARSQKEWMERNAKE